MQYYEEYLKMGIPQRVAQLVSESVQKRTMELLKKSQIVREQQVLNKQTFLEQRQHKRTGSYE